MIAKFVILSVVALWLCVSVESGIVPAAYPLPYAVAPYASSYNAHYVNHAIAAPVAAPLLAAPAYTAALPVAYHAAPAYPAPLIAG